MNRIYLYINVLFLLLLTGAISSCQNDSDMLGGGKADVNLTLQIGEQQSPDTRATIVDDLNEGVINTVDIFFYKDGATVTEAPVFCVTGMEPPEDTKNGATLNISIPVDKYEELFDPETTCKVYAIANRPQPDPDKNDNALPADDLSISSLKNATILYAPGFKGMKETQVGENTIYSPITQSDFVMDGEATVTKEDDALSGTIKLSRVAAKISVVVEGDSPLLTSSASSDNTWYVAEKDGGGTIIRWWKANINDVRISMNRGSVRTKLGTTPTEYLYAANKTNDIFSLSAISLDKVTENVDNKKTSLSTTIPFYTYPTNWKNDENSRTHFILVVQWTETDNPDDPDDSAPDDPQTIRTYYEVNVNAAASYTERNHHYRIKQKIGVLGSTEVATPVKLEPSYTVVDWGSAKDSEASTDSHGSLNRFRFLVVDETNVVMDNVEKKRISFFSSDPIKITTATIQWENTSGNTSQTDILVNQSNVSQPTADTNGNLVYTFSETSRLTGDYVVKITVHNANPNVSGDESYIYVEHNLNNEMTQYSDYSEYYIDFTVQHSSGNSNDAKYNETISITQYPMIAIKAEQNSKPNTNGGVWVNGGSSFGGVHGLGGNNSNPNRYIISVSALNSGSEYIIGDPREKNINIPLNNSSNAPTMKYPGDTNNRGLTYYHRTDESQSTKNMISPKFMIASSYGKTNQQSKAYARNRCATYQEDGYPAGRWRIPTEAEIQYIVQLSAWGVIPCLFGYEDENREATYWSANGAVAVNDYAGTANPVADVNVNSSYSVRCVYDTWYWTDKCTNTQFTWGDKADF